MYHNHNHYCIATATKRCYSMKMGCNPGSLPKYKFKRNITFTAYYYYYLIMVGGIFSLPQNGKDTLEIIVKT